jgi:hypothetical protein
MKDDDKGKRKKEKDFVFGVKLIRIIFDQSTILRVPNFLVPKKKSFFRFSFFSLAETTPLRALAGVRLRFSF